MTYAPGAARDEMSHRINFLDPPDHTRVRGLVSKAFTPRRVANLGPWMAATAERLLDEIGAADEVDLLRRFAHQLPSLVISELLGVPRADRDRLTAWSDAVAPLLGLSMTDAERAGAIAAAEDFHAYLSALLGERGQIAAGSVVEHSILGPSTSIGEGCMVSQTLAVEQPLKLPPEMLFFQVPIQLRGGRRLCVQDGYASHFYKKQCRR
jgi:hypothetical protein